MADSGLSADADDKGSRTSKMNGGKNKSMGWLVAGSSRPPHATQPISGGMPPTTEPTQVLSILFRFKLVYAPAYNTMFKVPSEPAIGFTQASVATPATPVTIPNIEALAGDIAPLTSGRILVRGI